MRVQVLLQRDGAELPGVPGERAQLFGTFWSLHGTTEAMSVIGNNFVELDHDLGYLPFNVIVRVTAHVDGNTYTFPGMGSVAVDGFEVEPKEPYGGENCFVSVVQNQCH